MSAMQDRNTSQGMSGCGPSVIETVRVHKKKSRQTDSHRDTERGNIRLCTFTEKKQRGERQTEGDRDRERQKQRDRDGDGDRERLRERTSTCDQSIIATVHLH